jgi:alanine-synthesizing transaminase
MKSLVNSRTRAIVVINPNNPSGAVYDRGTLASIVELAKQHGLVVMSDEIYDQMVYDEAVFIPMATLATDVVCLTFSGLSKIYRACGYRVGWGVFSGDLDRARDYIHGMELLASLRLCSNVPGQWAVQTALGGMQSIEQLVMPGGRLHQSRQTLIERVAASRFLDMERPMGAMYAFLRLDERFAGKLDDQEFALELLQSHHVLVAPGSSFNTPYTDYFRITTLPDTTTLDVVFDRMEACLVHYS